MYVHKCKVATVSQGLFSRLLGNQGLKTVLILVPNKAQKIMIINYNGH